MIFIPTHCEWIDDDNNKCGSPVIDGKSYCQCHYDQAYILVPRTELDQLVEETLGIVRNENTTDGDFDFYDEE